MLLNHVEHTSALERAEITQLSNSLQWLDDSCGALERAEITQLSNLLILIRLINSALERAEITQLSNQSCGIAFHRQL